ncbi:acetyltransferase (GNAT) family protein [Nocardia pseudobrasiliensis]|uniref:Acetyltransferase (GNAT) family protein n=2 Tax=Nocardia pseudobrasiliensis TaxID=45979 RepID=A0A370HP26_9NOCA|nr:acetyltransferase (GNAT) family protein [Nocardia pseudobrasiliensis]
MQEWKPLTLAEPWELTPVTPSSAAEIDLVAFWMSQAHVKFAMNKDWGRDGWQEEMEFQFSDNKTRPFLVGQRGERGGYVELYRVSMDVVADYYDTPERDMGMHGCIGEMEYFGYALPFWIVLIAGVFDAYPDCTGVISDPTASNHLVKALDRNVCAIVDGTEIGEIDLPHKRAALFRFERDNFAAAMDRQGGVDAVLRKLANQ